MLPSPLMKGRKCSGLHTEQKRPALQLIIFLVPGTGLEPARLAALAPKASVSTNSTTPA